MLKKGILFIFLLSSLLSTAQSDRYFALWNKNEVKIKPWNKISLSVSDRIQYNPKSNKLSSALAQLSIEHELKSWLEYGAAMRVIYTNLPKDNGITENRPMMFLILSKELKDFGLSFSNRIEFRSYKELEDYFRHKQTLKLIFPAIVDWGMRFYISEESFYKLNGIGTHAARFQSGVTAVDNKWLAMKVYYILEKSKVANYWLTGDIIGLNFSFSI